MATQRITHANRAAKLQAVLDSGFGLDWLRARVQVRPDINGCMVWSNKLDDGSVKANISGGNGKPAVNFNVRKTVWELAHERPLPHRWRAMCMHGQKGCVHPDHLMAMSESAARKGIPKTRKEREASMRAACSRAHLTHDKVLEMRFSAGTIKDKAARFGVSMQTVHAIMSGKRWKSARAGYGVDLS